MKNCLIFLCLRMLIYVTHFRMILHQDSKAMNIERGIPGLVLKKIWLLQCLIKFPSICHWIWREIRSSFLFRSGGENAVLKWVIESAHEMNWIWYTVTVGVQNTCPPSVVLRALVLFSCTCSLRSLNVPPQWNLAYR